MQCLGGDLVGSQLDLADEGRPVVGHGLGESEEAGGEVLGAGECDAQLAGPEFDAIAQIRRRATVDTGRRRNPDAPGGEVAAGGVQFLRQPGAPGDLPLKALPGGRIFQPLHKRRKLDGEGVTHAEAGESGHQLAGAPFADVEQILDRLAVEVGEWQTAQLRQNIFKAMKPSWLGGHKGDRSI